MSRGRHRHPHRLRWWEWAFWSSACRYTDLRDALLRDVGALLMFAGMMALGAAVLLKAVL